MSTVNVYVGKEMIKVDLDNLLGTEISTLDKITYETAKKYGDFIAAIEITVEDCLGTAVNITDEVSYKLAIADLVNIINEDKVDDIENINNQEEEIMMKINETKEVKAVQELLEKAGIAVEDIKVTAGETVEEYIEKADGSLDVLKSGFEKAVNTLDSITGFSLVKESVCKIMEAGTKNGVSAKSMKKMARECRDLVEKEQAFLIKCADKVTDEKAKGKLKEKIAKLDSLLNLCGRRISIFEAIVIAMIALAKKVAKTLRRLFQIDEEKSIIGAIFRGLSELGGILRAGIKLVWNTIEFGASFVIAGVVKVCAFLYRTIMTVISKIASWVNIRREKFTNEENFEDDFEDYDDEELTIE